MDTKLFLFTYKNNDLVIYNNNLNQINPMYIKYNYIILFLKDLCGSDEFEIVDKKLYIKCNYTLELTNKKTNEIMNINPINAYNMDLDDYIIKYSDSEMGDLGEDMFNLSKETMINLSNSYISLNDNFQNYHVPENPYRYLISLDFTRELLEYSNNLYDFFNLGNYNKLKLVKEIDNKNQIVKKSDVHSNIKI